MNRADAAKLVPMQLYYLGLRNEPPNYGRYNPLQKLAYSVVLFAIAPLIVLSGAAMLPFSMLHPIATIFVGGVKLWHFALMLMLCLFVIGHVGMVLATGLVKNMRSMITGGGFTVRAPHSPITETTELSKEMRQHLSSSHA